MHDDIPDTLSPLASARVKKVVDHIYEQTLKKQGKGSVSRNKVRKWWKLQPIEVQWKLWEEYKHHVKDTR